MDTIIDNVLHTYVSYGLVLISGKPEVFGVVSATFSEKEVSDFKDVFWNHCLDYLEEKKTNIHPSSLGSRIHISVYQARSISRSGPTDLPMQETVDATVEQPTKGACLMAVPAISTKNNNNIYLKSNIQCI